MLADVGLTALELPAGDARPVEVPPSLRDAQQDVIDADPFLLNFLAEAALRRRDYTEAVALRQGDVLVITRLSRAMRSLRQLLDLAADLQARGVGLVVLKQDIDTTSATGRLVFHILAAIDEWQRELIVEGTHEGLAAARARGRVGGRKPKLTEAQVKHARELYSAGGHTVAEIGKLLGVSRQTIYRALEPESVATA